MGTGAELLVLKGGVKLLDDRGDGEGGRDRQCPDADLVGIVALRAAARAVEDCRAAAPVGLDQGGRAAAIKVEGVPSTEGQQDVGALGICGADAIPGLTSVDRDYVEVAVVL